MRDAPGHIGPGVRRRYRFRESGPGRPARSTSARPPDPLLAFRGACDSTTDSPPSACGFSSPRMPSACYVNPAESGHRSFDGASWPRSSRGRIRELGRGRRSGRANHGGGPPSELREATGSFEITCCRGRLLWRGSDGTTALGRCSSSFGRTSEQSDMEASPFRIDGGAGVSRLTGCAPIGDRGRPDVRYPLTRYLVFSTRWRPPRVS